MHGWIEPEKFNLQCIHHQRNRAISAGIGTRVIAFEILGAQYVRDTGRALLNKAIFFNNCQVIIGKIVIVSSGIEQHGQQGYKNRKRKYQFCRQIRSYGFGCFSWLFCISNNFLFQLVPVLFVLAHRLV